MRRSWEHHIVGEPEGGFLGREHENRLHENGSLSLPNHFPQVATAFFLHNNFTVISLLGEKSQAKLKNKQTKTQENLESQRNSEKPRSTGPRVEVMWTMGSHPHLAGQQWWRTAV